MDTSRQDQAVDRGKAPVLREITPPGGPIRRIQEIWAFRQLLRRLTRKEVRVKYMNSVLGLAWSLLNPALYLVVFWVVFEGIFKTGIPAYPLFLVSGLVVWNFFGGTLSQATSSIVANGPLVNKVYFPKEILPLSSIASGLVHFFLQLLVVGGALIVFRRAPSPAFLLLLPVAVVVLLLLMGALSLITSACNVHLRDTQHSLELLLLVWFWMTPIVYQSRLLSDRLGNWFLLNPLAPIVITFQRALYNRVSVTTEGGGTEQLLPAYGALWYLRNLAIVGGIATVVLLVAIWQFGRIEEGFAEEI